MIDITFITLNALLLGLSGVAIVLFLLKKDSWRCIMQGVTLSAIIELVVIFIFIVVKLGIDLNYPFWVFFGFLFFFAAGATLIGYFLYISKKSYGKDLLLFGIFLDVSWIVLFFGTVTLAFLINK